MSLSPLYDRLTPHSVGPASAGRVGRGIFYRESEKEDGIVRLTGQRRVKTIKIRTKVFPRPQNLALFVAEAKGYFDRHGIDADVQITVGSDEQRAALADGAVEVIHSAVDNAVHMVEAAGQDIIIVSGGSNGMNDLIVRAEIDSYADLRGKTVVVEVVRVVEVEKPLPALANWTWRRRTPPPAQRRPSPKELPLPELTALLPWK